VIFKLGVTKGHMVARNSSLGRRCHSFSALEFLQAFLPILIFLERSIAAGIATTLRAGRSGVRIPVKARGFSVLFCSLCSGAHLVSYTIGTRVLSLEQSGRSVNISTHLHQVPTLKMSAAISVLTLHAFMTWTGRSLFYPFILSSWSPPRFKPRSRSPYNLRSKAELLVQGSFQSPQCREGS
jgi:hypothetical protein